MNAKRAETLFRLSKKLAATYSRASFTCTTIGKAVFDGRVRDGIGSDHRFMATKKLLKNAYSLKTTHRISNRVRELKSHFLVTRKKRSSRTTD